MPPALDPPVVDLQLPPVRQHRPRPLRRRLSRTRHGHPYELKLKWMTDAPGTRSSLLNADVTRMSSSLRRFDFGTASSLPGQVGAASSRFRQPLNETRRPKPRLTRRTRPIRHPQVDGKPRYPTSWRHEVQHVMSSSGPRRLVGASKLRPDRPGSLLGLIAADLLGLLVPARTVSDPGTRPPA